MAGKSETETKIRELRVLEQNLTQVLMQKQAIEIEMNELANALKEINSIQDKNEIYRMTGSILLKTTHKKVSDELNSRKKTLDMQMEAVEKQENIMEMKAEELKKSLQTP